MPRLGDSARRAPARPLRVGEGCRDEGASARSDILCRDGCDASFGRLGPWSRPLRGWEDASPGTWSPVERYAEQPRAVAQLG
jgi:hypothetical protein